MIRLTTLTAAAALTAGTAAAQEMHFNRVASFPVADNMAEGADRSRESSAEIIAATPDGRTLVYTDSPLGALGFIDIADPAAPEALGLIEIEGEPTSVAIAGGMALLGVNTSESYTEPSGHLAAIEIEGRSEAARCDLGGQPDAVAVAPDDSFLAVAIENERDEDLNDGEIPQMPAGFVVLIDLDDQGTPLCDSLRQADVTGLAEVAPSDPEPEFVDINAEGETVVTLQENNHIVVLDREGGVVSHFSAGAVDLQEIDTVEDGALLFDDAQPGRKREPDAVKWIDEEHFATANEGDYEGGSRGFTIFAQDGTVIHESGPAFEHAIVQVGHYPEGRSDAKGVEPESVAYGEFGGTPILFVGAERASIVGVYDIADPAEPRLRQLLPSGIGPEGYAVIPDRGLLVSANETDLVEDGGARSHVMIYQMQEGAPRYPHLTSQGMDELTGWGAISGMVSDGQGRFYAVADSFYALQPRIMLIDPSQEPARIVDTLPVTREGRPAQKLDLEGIALDGEGGYWLASEGRTDRLIPHAILRTDESGEIVDEIGLPPELMAVERRFGFEGITVIDGVLWMAVQREWADDPENHVKLVAYDPEAEEWGAVLYPKSAPAGEGWVGLSEIVADGDWVYVIERDNQIGQAAKIKKIYRIALSQMEPAPLGGELPVVEKEEVRDLLGDLGSIGGYVQDKVEGLAIMDDGTIWVSTDNDGVDDASGETMLFSVPAP